MLAVLSTLIVAAVIGGVVMFRDVGVAQDNIEHIENEQKKQADAIQRGLDKIGAKLDKIADAINEQKIEGAKYHHEHD